MTLFLFFNPDASKVQILRYEDPEVGPRKIPEFDNPEAGKIVISPSAVFHIDLEKKSVSVQENGKSINLGKQLVYLVK